MLHKTRKILVTYALPYANGSLHLGHLVGFIQTDIWVRFQKMRGADCLFICGCDGHGTPIMIQAEKLNIPPEQLIEQFRAEHKQDIEGFLIALDNYHTTHSEENQKIVSAIFQKHVEKGNIE
ncbi:MAG: metG 1, partial [Gammaproteobacteria bacterium]|nr:metG 1 [Gammaproteobacteria bacterium]